MKCISICFSLLLAPTAAAATSINEVYDEQVHQLQLRGTPGTKRGQDWLKSNQSYLNGALQWDKTLKQKAEAYALKGLENCDFPNMTGVNGLITNGRGHKLSALPSTDSALQRWENKGVLGPYLASMTNVGCADALRKGTVERSGCWTGVCLYSK